MKYHYKRLMIRNCIFAASSWVQTATHKKATNRFYMLKTSWINSLNGLFRLRMTCLKTRILRPEAERSSRHTDIRFYHMLYFGSDPKQVLQGALDISDRRKDRRTVRWTTKNPCKLLPFFTNPCSVNIREANKTRNSGEIFFLSYPVITAWVI